MKTRPGAPMCAGVKQGVNEVLLSFRGARSANPESRDGCWIPGPREDACPGMTTAIVIARSVADEAIQSFSVASGLLRFARNDTQLVMLLI